MLQRMLRSVCVPLTCLIFMISPSFSPRNAACEAAMPLGSRPLSYGARGDDVLELQYRLNLLGFYIKVLDGIFGSETRRAVLEFQSASNLPRTGDVDGKTAQLILEGKARRTAQHPKPAQPPDSGQQPKAAQQPAQGTRQPIQPPKTPQSNNRAAEREASPAPKPAPSKPAAGSDKTLTVHVVKAGECLSVIGQRYGATTAGIMKQNGLKGTTIYVGQKLMIPRLANRPQERTYEVKDGDCLYFIAKEFRTTVAAIAKANGLRNPDLIRPGQSLLIPPA